MKRLKLRDLFAGLAIVGAAAKTGAGKYDELADNAYALADAMLRARKKKDGSEPPRAATRSKAKAAP